MSASDLAPFVAAVIEDGIVAELQRKNKELESKIHKHESERLNVQITGQGGNRIYGEKSLKTGSPFPGDSWLLYNYNDDDEFVCPFDEESVTQLEIRVGGIVLLKPFLMADNRYPSFRVGFKFNIHLEPIGLNFHLIPSNHSKSPMHTISGWLRLAASSSKSMDDKITFQSLAESLIPIMMGEERIFQLDHLLHHFDTLINTDDERGVGTKLIISFETIEFRKDSISGCMSLMEELGIRTTI